MDDTVTERDEAGHPELTLVRWASRHLTPEARAVHVGFWR